MASATSGRFVITGGLGFIGSNLALAAARAGASVTVVDNLLPGCGGRRDNIPAGTPGVTVVDGDARDVALMERLARDADVVFSLAGKTAHLESMTHPLDDLEHNVRAPLATLEGVRRSGSRARVIFASTRQVYGAPRYLPVDEEHPIHPPDVNAVHKFAAEQHHALYARVYGMPTVSLRLSNVYGPRVLTEHDRQGFIGWFTGRVLANEVIPVFGDGRQRRDFCYVGDLADAFLAAAGADLEPGGAYNIVGATVASLAEVAQEMCAVGGSGRVEFRPFPEEKKRIDIGDYVGTGARFERATGWRPRVQLADGLRATFDFFRGRAPQAQPA